MEVCKETLKHICSMCLSVDRKLTQLCKIRDDVQNLFLLLTKTSEKHKVTYCKDTTSLFACWECVAVMRRFCMFRDQVCYAQKQMLNICDGIIKFGYKQNDLNVLHKCLSKLSQVHYSMYNYELVETKEIQPDHCIINTSEVYMKEDAEDPSVELNEVESGVHNYEMPIKEENKQEEDSQKLEDNEKQYGLRPVADHKDDLTDKSNNNNIRKETNIFTVLEMTEVEMLESLENKRIKDSFINAVHKCDLCLKIFKNVYEQEAHHFRMHTMGRPYYLQCEICKIFVSRKLLTKHKHSHFLKYKCLHCTQEYYELTDIHDHVKNEHSLKIDDSCKLQRKTKVPSITHTSPNEYYKGNGHDKFKNGSNVESSLIKDHETITGTLEQSEALDCVIKLEPEISEVSAKDFIENKDDKLQIANMNYVAKGDDKDAQRENKNYLTIKMSETELVKIVQMKKLEAEYVNSPIKCDSCVKSFRSFDELHGHNTKLHTKRPDYVECDICKVYIEESLLQKHKKKHYLKYRCHRCFYECYNLTEILDHSKQEHGGYEISDNKVKIKNGSASTLAITSANDKPAKKNSLQERRKYASMEPPTPLGFLCTDCNKYFKTYHQRYVHIRRTHKEGLACTTCGKTFPYMFHLKKHQRIHERGSFPQEPCTVCGKMIRTEAKYAHMKIHGDRAKHYCAKCDKTFASRYTYETHVRTTLNHTAPAAPPRPADTKKTYECVDCNKRYKKKINYLLHLKYARVHADEQIYPHKCPECGKCYRYPDELRDHVNFKHKGSTQHKCPICNKALATLQSVKRHVKCAHGNVKDAKNKVCQTCGKAFKSKKCLREHESVHTGQRPFCCDFCGDTFRQSAALYTHKRRVHKVPLKHKAVTLISADDNA